MTTNVEELADQLAVDPGDVCVILRQLDVHSDELRTENVFDVQAMLDPGGERSRHLNPPDPFGLGSRWMPKDR